MQHEKFQSFTLKINTIIWHRKKIPITFEQGCRLLTRFTQNYTKQLQYVSKIIAT